MSESAYAKRRLRRIPDESRKRNAQSCDRCRKVSKVVEDWGLSGVDLE
jgi:hypothetical protein